MNQYEYGNNNNYQEKIFNNNGNEITEEINQSLSSNYLQLEKDIFNSINCLRANPSDFCNNLFQKEKYRQNCNQIEIMNFIENINNKDSLKPYKEIHELSEAARNLLNNIGFHYKKYHNLNMKEMDPAILNLRNRLSNYGERTGRIFETVLFKMDNPEDIVNHILKEEKGRNMLLSHKMKYIGIACDIISSNLICTIIDIVQDFVPYKDKNNNDNINNNIDNIIDININDSFNKKINTRNSKKKNCYYKNNSEYISLMNNLNYKNSKDNLKLNIILPEKKIQNDNNNTKCDKNFNGNNKNNFECNNILNKKTLYYKTPIKLTQMEIHKNNDNNLSPKSDYLNNINIKKIMPKRNHSNNINIIKKDSNNNNKEEIGNIKFTMAGRSYKDQQDIIEISTKKNLNKSKSVCSYDINSNNSKTGNKNKFQRLNHEEKMEILHKINHNDNKTPNSQSVSHKNSEIVIKLNPLTSNKNNSNNIYIQKNINNTNNFLFENRSKKSPMRNFYNPEYFDINSETDQLYFNKNTKDSNINFLDGINQTYTDLKSNEAMENNEEYSKNKINQIKNDLMHIRDQIKKELKEEVSEELRNEFNQKLFYGNKRNKPTMIQLEDDYGFNNKNINNYYNGKEKRNTYDGNNEINENIYYNKNNINNKKKGKNRWSSAQRYYYINNNNNNINNINNTNIILPDNDDSQYIHQKGRKSSDWKDLIKENSNNNNDGIKLKEKYKEKYEKLNYIPISNNSHIIGNNHDNNIRRSFQNEYINNNGKRHYFNEGYKMKNKQEIKKLIRLYNMAKDDKRNRSIIDNNNAYDIFNNNKSISNYNFNQNNYCNNDKINENNIKINDEINNNNKININNYYNISGNYYGDNYDYQNNPVNLKNDIRSNYNNNFKNSEEENSIENDFVKGHRFQIKYQKVKPKGQIYRNKVPKPRNSSIKNKISNNIYSDSKSYDYPFINNTNKTEDIVNLENTNINNEKEELNIKENINNAIINYNNLQNEKNENKYEGKNNNINNIVSNEKLSITGRFVEENKITEESNNNNLKGNDITDLKKNIYKNIIYKGPKNKHITSKSEIMDYKNIIVDKTTKKNEINTPEKQRDEDEEYITNRKVHKNQSDIFNDLKVDKNNDIFYQINNMKDIRNSNLNGTNQYINKKVQKKNIPLDRKTYDKIKNNKKNYLEIENDFLKTPNQFKKDYYLNENNIYDNSNKTLRSNNNLTTKTTSFYKKKKYTPYPYYPYEYTVNYKDNNNSPKKINYIYNKSLEKKYIKDPEGNLIETYVKKNNDGNILLQEI